MKAGEDGHQSAWPPTDRLRVRTQPASISSATAAFISGMRR
jgi:hypothetical protein